MPQFRPFLIQSGRSRQSKLRGWSQARIYISARRFFPLVFGEASHRMANLAGVFISESIDGEAVRHDMLNDFGIEIGTSFGPLHGKVWSYGPCLSTSKHSSVLGHSDNRPAAHRLYHAIQCWRRCGGKLFRGRQMTRLAFLKFPTPVIK